MTKTNNIMTLQEMTNGMPANHGKMFSLLYKELVQTAMNHGESLKEANRTAFNILVKEDKYCKIMNIA